MAITQAELSRRLKVSQATVSMAFNNSKKLPQKTRIRIMQKAGELGYLPNISARAVRTGKSGCISLLQNRCSRENSLPPSLVNGIKMAVGKCGKRLNLIDLDREHLPVKEHLPKLLNKLSTDGLLIDFTYSIHKDVMEVISKTRLPFVYLNYKNKENCFFPNDHEIGFMAVNYLKMLGHKRIAYLNMSLSEHYSTKDRFIGYCDAIKPLEGISLLKDVAFQDRQLAIEKWLNSFSEIPTAFFCYEIREAIPLYVVLTKLGYSIPRDISLIAVHDRVINDIGVNMTTLVLPFYELGMAAVEALSQKIDNRDILIPAESFSAVLVPGDTTAPVL